MNRNFAPILLAIALALLPHCGATLFPKCGEPGVECPPCGDKAWPNACAGGPDAAAEAGK